jgi:hypothetical protein
MVGLESDHTELVLDGFYFYCGVVPWLSMHVDSMQCILVGMENVTYCI